MFEHSYLQQILWPDKTLFFSCNWLLLLPTTPRPGFTNVGPRGYLKLGAIFKGKFFNVLYMIGQPQGRRQSSFNRDV